MKEGHRELLGHATPAYWEMLARHFNLQRPHGDDVVPLSIFGDEIQVLSAETSTIHEDTRASRYLIALLPKRFYYMDRKVNRTLQAVMKVITDSMNKLETAGCTVGGKNLRGLVASVKGDWKFFGQLLNARVGPSSNEICHICRCTKDLQRPYTDITEGALWRSDPRPEDEVWYEKPTVTNLNQWKISLLAPDIMHTFHLGTGRDIAASVLTILLRSRVFSGSNVAARMVTASRLIREWSKKDSTRNVLPSTWSLKKSNLGLKTGSYVHYHGKAWHIATILGFLVDFLEEQDVDSDLKMICWTGDYIMSMLHQERKDSGLLLSEESKEALRVVGGYHNKLLLSLHIRYKGFCCYLLFNVRPKFHTQVHMLETAAQTGRNPVVQANWMEEDFVRTVANLAKKTHKRTSHLTTLLRYTAGH